MSGIPYAKLLTEAYQQVFKEDPAQASRVIYYRAAKGGYVKVFPGPKATAYLVSRPNNPAVKCTPVGVDPDPMIMKIIRIAGDLINEQSCFPHDYVKHTSATYRAKGGYIDVMSDDFAPPSSSY